MNSNRHSKGCFQRIAISPPIWSRPSTLATLANFPPIPNRQMTELEIALNPLKTKARREF